MTERDKILGRIREALAVPAAKPGHDHGNGPVAGDRASAQAREWLPPVGAAFEDQLARFQANAADLKASFQLLEDENRLYGAVRALRDSEGWKRIASHAGNLTDLACAAIGLPVCRTDGAYDVNELETCDVGITECDALVAQTGSVLITNRSAGGRALSILPPHHLVLARRQQIVRDLPAAFELLKNTYGSNYPTMISFITGPSRTGDIERILVLGAHGPKTLTILCI